MKRFCFFVFGLVLLVASCKSSKSSATASEIASLDSLVKQQSFKIESNWAYPQTTNAMQQVFNSGLLFPGSTVSAINLIGNPNFLKLSGDSISSHLPYYGERQMQVEYGGRDNAIVFDGLVENFKVAPGKHSSYNISFTAKSNSESFNVNITLFPNMKSNMVLTGATRFSISYSGTVVQDEE